MDDAIAHVGKEIVLGLPLALGKANHIANAFYARAKADPSIRLTIYTALTLEVPGAPNALAERLLGPITERLYGGYPALDYARDRHAGKLPPNVTVKEFFLPTGSLVNNAYAQRNYVSANYTHAAREILSAGINVIAQMVASSPDGGDGLSLSCNTDLSLDLIPALHEHAAKGMPVAVLGEINRELPWLGNEAEVPADWFTGIVDAGSYTLFSVPAVQVSTGAYALGLQAATLLKDDGTLQIGIGALSDALSHAIRLRHERNDEFRAAVTALRGEAAAPTDDIGGLAPFEKGIYAASEMVTEGLLMLLERGILSRAVHDDLAAQIALDEGKEPTPALPAYRLHGGFYLGPRSMYERLRNLPDHLRDAIDMTAISRVNDLFGEEALARRQRRKARFFNTAMKVNGRGAAISDTLEDGRVVSGVGGQYNFVAMAHALEDGRSIIMLRATRMDNGKPVSNIVWQAGEVTVPRHLRDIVVTEYGIADLRGATDRDIVVELTRICDSRFQEDFVKTAKTHRKLEPDWQLPAAWRNNTPERIAAALADARTSGLLPDYPFGTDLTEVETDLREALEWLKQETATWKGRAVTIAAALAGADRTRFAAHLERMKLDRPSGAGEWLEARLIAHALAQVTAGPR